MYENRVQQNPGHELAKQSLSKPSSQAHHLSAIPFIESIIQSSDPTGFLVMILVGCMSIVVSGCGGFVLNGNGATASPSKSGNGPSGSPSLSMVSCGTQSLTGPQTKGCSVYLNSLVVKKSVVVSLHSSNPAVTVPMTATISVGSSSAGFNAISAGVSSAQNVTLTASAGSVSMITVIQLYPAPTISSSLSSISCGTQSLTGPQTKACSLYLNTSAQSPVLVSLASDNPAVTLPRSVTIVAGATSGGFNVTAAAVNTTQTVTLTASANGASTTDVMQLLASNAPSPTPQHQVQLNWDAPTGTTSPIAGYRVYRAPGGTTSFGPLNSSIDSNTSYTDSTVLDGQSYAYEVKSVDTKGTESAPSNMTTVAIP